MHSKSDNMEIMINDKAEKVIGKLFELLFNKSNWSESINDI